jgi:hypothetical protein
MPGKKLCPECGVAGRVIKEHDWLANGTIVQKENRDHRMLFIETKNLSETFDEIEEIIGMPIERIVTEAKRRATYDFVSHSLPGIVKTVVKVVGVRPVVNNIDALGSVMGYGDIEVLDIKRRHTRGDYVVIGITEPYSLPLFCGDLGGAFNAVLNREVAVEYEQKGDDYYVVTGHISKHPLELQERLQTRPYQDKPGDIGFEKCPECGGPLALKEFRWDIDRGVIKSSDTGRRMAILGPGALDATINELQKELGETIPEVVVEAQRRAITGGDYKPEEVSTGPLFRNALAIRGFGNVKDIKWRDGPGIDFRVECSCLHPIIAGLSLGFFEMGFGVKGHVEYEETPDGDLHVDISAES